MDGQQPATPEPNKDSGRVDGFQTATTEDRHRGNIGDVVKPFGPWTRREILESSLTAASQRLIRSALFAVLPTTSSVSCIQWHGVWHQRRPRQQFRRSFPVVSTIVTPTHRGQPSATTSVRPECGSLPGRWIAQVRPYHSSPATAPLVACEATYRV